jgi:rod shape determining protein RodA
MWSYQALSRIDLRLIPLVITLMAISLLVIASFSPVASKDYTEEPFFTPQVKRQMESFVLGGAVFLFLAGFDYRKLREATWPLYGFMILTLLGLFLTDPIQRVQRWYKIPLIGLSFQPSEYAKLIVVITLSWFLERRRSQASSLRTALYAMIIVGIPFLMILKQPDLGTALVLFPITLVMFYFGDIHQGIIKWMALLSVCALAIVALIFSGLLPHEEIRPYAAHFLKDYQFDRLDPNTHHQKAAVTAIAIGGLTGSGWKKSQFSGNGFLPAPYTDSVFPAFGEEFGLIGLCILLSLYYALIYFSFQVACVAKDLFGRLLSAGLAIYLTMHILVNIGMMCGLLPITGVPLILVTYGGSSNLATMAALGLLQSVYSRRFMF